MVPASSHASPSVRAGLRSIAGRVRERVAGDSRVKLAATMETLRVLEPLARRAQRAGAQRCGSRRDPRRAGRHVHARFRRPARLSVPDCGFTSQCDFRQGVEGPFISRALARRRSGRTRFGPSLRSRRGAGVPHRRRGPAGRSRAGGHRGHSAAPSSSWINPFSRPRRPRRPCRARMDGLHGSRDRSRSPRCARSNSSTRKQLAPEVTATAPSFSLRNPPKRYKHLFVYSGDRPAT